MLNKPLFVAVQSVWLCTATSSFQRNFVHKRRFEIKTKKATKTNAKSRIIFFAIAITYNLLLGLYLKDFFVLSPMLLTLYLLSALPTLFFVPKIRSTPMRAIVYVVLFFVMIMSIVVRRKICG